MSAPAKFLFLLSLLAVIFRLGIELYLAYRQVAKVRSGKDSVPKGFEETITPSAHRKSCDYALAKLRVSFVEHWVDAVLLILLLCGGLALLGEWIVPEKGLLQGALLLIALVMISSLTGLGFAIYRQFVIERKFGFSSITPALFITDRIKGLGLSLLFGLPLLAAMLWTVDRAGPWWWLYAWGLFAGFNLLITVAFPLFIAPLFNRFTPLEEGDLRQRMTALLERCGFSGEDLFVVDGSRRSRHSNAYFTGFGRAKRVVLFDTLVSLLSIDEIAAVLAHELGHFKLRHIGIRIAWALGSAFLIFALMGWLFSHGWFYEGFGLEVASGSAFAITLLIMPAFHFPLSPLFTALSRRHEFQADAFAVDIEGARHLQSALVKLYRDNAAVLSPDPLYSRFYDSHPPAGERLAHLRTLDA